jgi:hypothetical protein
VTGGTISGTTGDFSGNVDINGTLDVDDVISVEGSAFGRIEIGGASGGLKAPNSDDYDFRIITSSGGNEITTATGDLIFNTAETLALTIDTSQDATFAGNINIGDNQKILFGDSGDVEMFFNGSTFVIDDTVEVFGFDIDTNLIRFRGTDLYTEISNGQHTFWTNGTERFKINATEVKVSHQLNVTGDLIVDTDTLFVDVSTDSVGIGLTNPSDYSADELVISVPDDSGMTLVSGTTDTAYITFADGTTAASQGGFISHDHNTDTLTVFSKAKVSIGILEAEVAYFTDVACYIDKSTTFAGGITSTYANVSGGVNGGYFRTAAANTDYNLITRDGTGNALFVQKSTNS